MKTITNQIANRMAAAQKEKLGHLKELASIGKQSRQRHDQIAVGKGNVSDESRSAALDGLMATSDFCEATTGGSKKPAHHGTRDHVGKFSKPGSFGHLQRLVAGKE